MTELRIGSLFSGYGGLDLAVHSVLGGRTAWVSDVDPGPCKILAHRFDAPNLGDITLVDWSAVEPVDVLTLGFPCQDVSTAGNQAGIRPGSRSGLWSYAAYAIAELRPRLVVIENVRGLLSAPAHSDVEPCPWCLGDDPSRALRALGAVLGDLAGVGYDAQWCGVRASDIDAPHERFRVAIAAHPAGHPWRLGDRDPDAAAYSAGVGGRALRQDVRRSCGSNRSRRGGELALFPTPRASDTNGSGTHGEGGVDLRTAVSLLPTPSVADTTGGRKSRSGARSSELLLNGIAAEDRWAEYAPAVRRWERATRPVPAPTEVGPKGNIRLSPRFTEWMMGLPDGWVTQVPGIGHVEAGRALGNGVVPQQIAAGLHHLLMSAAVA